MTPLCFVDTETDGVHPDRKVWEVALIRRDMDGDLVRETRVTGFVDIDLSTADPFGLQVGGFYARHPMGRFLAGDGTASDWEVDSNSFTPAEAAYTVARMTHGAHLVGVVPSFDAEVLGNLLRVHQLTPAWHYHLVDVEAMAAGRLLQAPPWSSDDLSRRCHVDPPDETARHTAMGDTEWALRWYDSLVAAA